MVVSRAEKAFMVSVVSVQRGGGGSGGERRWGEIRAHIAAETLKKKYNNRGKSDIWREKEAWYQIEGSD